MQLEDVRRRLTLNEDPVVERDAAIASGLELSELGCNVLLGKPIEEPIPVSHHVHVLEIVNRMLKGRLDVILVWDIAGRRYGMPLVSGNDG